MHKVLINLESLSQKVENVSISTYVFYVVKNLWGIIVRANSMRNLFTSLEWRKEPIAIILLL